MNNQKRLATAIAAFGNLFLLVTTPELRKRNITPLAFYVLQRSIQEADRSKGQADAYSASRLTRETQLPDYETSRACTLLKRRELVTIAPGPTDKRVRVLIPTQQGRALFREIMAAAGKRLWNGIPQSARKRRVWVLTKQLREADQTLYGVWRPSFFDPDI